MKQIKMSEEKHKAVIDNFVSLVGKIENDNNRNALEKLMEDFADRLFSVPASNKLIYHNCFIGGLAEHSLRVYNNLVKLRDAFAPEISNDSVTICALFHDLGKVGTKDEPYYVEQESDWHREKLGEYYLFNPNLEYMSVAHRSLRLLSEYGVELSDLEYKAILIHDGQYVAENKPYAHKEGWLGLLLHQADMIACKKEHEIWEKVQ